MDNIDSTSKLTVIYHNLRALGIPQNASLIFCYLLTVPRAKVSTICQATGIHKNRAYESLRYLTTHNLVVRIKVTGQSTKFAFRDLHLFVIHKRYAYKRAEALSSLSKQVTITCFTQSLQGNPQDASYQRALGAMNRDRAP
jgi:sugar-specific transcriptional regulator TrmB